MSVIRPGSLVLYKNRPARILRMGDRLDIEGEDGELARVRPKDIHLLHPGPLASLQDLAIQAGDVHTAWEILSGERTTLAELAELAFGSFTPVSAWSAWQWVVDQLYFSGTSTDIRAHSKEEVEQKKKARAQAEAEQQAWRSFVERARRGIYDEADRAYFIDVENLALGRSDHSRLLVGLGRPENPESAHELLINLGIWDAFVNPYPVRENLSLKQVELLVPDVPPEERLDLTHLQSFAIDDEGTDTPDDALALDGERIWVHIADVSSLVHPGDPIDLEAQSRGMSLHLPEGTIHLLPREVTLRLGLGLQEVSPALSFGFEIDAHGMPNGLTILPSWVRVQRLSYARAEPMIDEEPLCEIDRLLSVARERRRLNHAVMLDFPEVRLFVVDGRVDIQPILPLRSRILVEEAMILTSMAAAMFAAERGIPFPYSWQERVDVDERPGTLSGMFALRKYLKRSQFEISPRPHHGLGVPAYAQVTSPLRRYLDLVAHQQLRGALRQQNRLDWDQVNGRIAGFEAVIDSVRRAELRSERHWTLVYLLQHPGWRGEGILVDKRGASGTVILPALGLETRIHLPQDLPLDKTLPVMLTGVDLPRLEASFRVTG